MRSKQSLMGGFQRVAFGFLVVVFLMPGVTRALEEDVRSLLQVLSIQAPASEIAAPAFMLRDVNGATVRLADYQGRVVMLYFWTTW